MAEGMFKRTGKTVADLILAARKKPFNFALVLDQKTGVVVEADRRKKADTLFRMAKREASSIHGAWGEMRVSGKTITFDCEDEPPGPLYLELKRFLMDQGLRYKLVLRVPEPPPEEDEPGDDLSGLLIAARKTPCNVAMMIGDGGIVLRWHRRKRTDILVRAAKQDGGGRRGAWGTMRLKGKNLVLQCEEEPPTALPRAAKRFFRDRGEAVKLLFQSPAGAILSDEDPVEFLRKMGVDSRKQYFANHKPEFSTKEWKMVARILKAAVAAANSGRAETVKRRVRELDLIVLAKQVKQEKARADALAPVVPEETASSLRLLQNRAVAGLKSHSPQSAARALKALSLALDRAESQAEQAVA
jgi:hypothetical protein